MDEWISAIDEKCEGGPGALSGLSIFYVTPLFRQALFTISNVCVELC